jgi:lysophospholipase L1-like esterase
MRLRLILCGALLGGSGIVRGTATEPVRDFWFGDRANAPSASAVIQPADGWTPDRGYGWEPGFAGQATATGATGSQAFYFTTTLPHEGNYLVTLDLGGGDQESVTTVKAELRRVMLQQIRVQAGEVSRQQFVVNVRSPRIAAANGIGAGGVALKSPRETTQEAWAWDDALTLEFSGLNPQVQRVIIELAPEFPTVFLIGDSTVCDQSREPYASWGQLFTRFFKPTVAVANHAESGETYRDSIGRRRLDKIISVMRPGDYLLMQFGHNDQKQIKAGNGGPFTTYAEEMRQHIAAVKRVGGIPIVLSPMERRGFTPDGSVTGSLADYAGASAQVATEETVRFIDLNARSRVLYAALGPAVSAAAFAAPDGKQDNTHHNNYGAWLIAACVLQDLVAVAPEIGVHVRDGLPGFDPASPPAESDVHVPPSLLVTAMRPLGD